MTSTLMFQIKNYDDDHFIFLRICGLEDKDANMRIEFEPPSFHFWKHLYNKNDVVILMVKVDTLW